MCGFAGILDASNQTRRDELSRTVVAMAAAVSHRGPDDAGSWVDEHAGVGLGFRRLAILDLSKAGHQPMASRNERFVIVFNGEIYNHRELRSELSSQAWSGHSDTETLLACIAAWGVRKTLERTVGMFAFALWDRTERRLHLARDRFGEKPLYYGWVRQSFVFGSEIKALRQFPGFDNQIDRDVLAQYLQYSCVPAPYSIYRHIYKLEPGCVLSITPDATVTPAATALFSPTQQIGLTLDRYWSLTDVAECGIAHPFDDEHEAENTLEAALMHAVHLQSIADVPLGAFLSGGIDSSLIVALMQAQSSHPVRTFTIGFDEDGFNEAAHAKTVAAHLGTEHTELYVSAQQARDTIPKLPDLYSEPFADSSQIPTHLVSCIARQEVTVALSGDGGDELFGGYSRHLWGPHIWNRLRWLPAPLRRGLASTMERISPAALDRLGKLATNNRLVSRPGEKANKLARRLRNADSSDALYQALVTMWPTDTSVVYGARPLTTPLDAAVASREPSETAQRWMLWDALTYLPDDILHKVDRASMGASLETRAPFLDHRVAELTWRLPLDMKIRNGKGKWILRQILNRHVPQSLIERPKMGFGVPIDAWLRGPLRDWAEDLLSESKLRSDGYFDPAPIRQRWEQHVAGERDWQHELWAVLMFQAWAS